MARVNVAGAILEGGDLQFRSLTPALRPYLGCFWSLATTVKTRMRGLPDGCCMLSVESNPKRAHCFLSGPQLMPTERTPSGGQLLFGVRLQPGVAFLLTGMPVYNLAGRRTRLADVLPHDPEAAQLEHSLARAGSLNQRLDLLEEFLRVRLVGRTIDPRVETAVRRIQNSAGQIRTTQLARASGASPRHLTRLFRRWTGLSPKRLARFTRFQAMLQHMEVSSHEGLAQTAAELGYFDQSHLSRDAVRLSGMSPMRIGRRHMADFSKTRCD